MNAGMNDELIASAVETLARGENLLAGVSDAIYSLKVSVAFNASIGGHYRHCLDHFRAVLDAAAEGDLNYDRRERGTLVENDRYAALNATRELREGFERLDRALLCRALAVTCKTRYASENSQAAQSTVGRELMYSVAHAVHHFALIKVIGAVAGHQMPDDFGVAPSTLRHQAASRAG